MNNGRVAALVVALASAVAPLAGTQTSAVGVARRDVRLRARTIR